MLHTKAAVFILALGSELFLCHSTFASVLDNVSISPDMQEVTVTDHYGGKGSFHVDVAEDPAKPLAFIEAQAQQYGIPVKLDNCELAITVSVPRHNGNISYGAACTLKDGEPRSRVEICSDQMVGRFVMQSSPMFRRHSTDDDLNKKSLISFVAQHCVGG